MTCSSAICDDKKKPKMFDQCNLQTCPTAVNTAWQISAWTSCRLETMWKTPSSLSLRFFAFQHNVLDRDFLDFQLFCTFSVNLRMKNFQTNIFPALHAALESNAAECGAKTFEPSKLWTTATVSRRDPSW